MGLFNGKELNPLLCGFETADDAAVYKLSNEIAIVFTTDFFPPIVDDPYDYGAIAAANALSDIYAMGGEPLVALNLFSCPPNVPKEMQIAILKGGMEKVKEAGAIVGGGHTMEDKEPKYGLAVVGRIDPDRMISNHTVEVGDLILLTKPLGVGVITTALKRGQVDLTHVAEASRWMKILNWDAARAAIAAGVHAMTDITGYGLIGHLHEMLQPREYGARIRRNALPYHPGTMDLAAEYVYPAGALANHQFYREDLRFAEPLEEWEEILLCAPETSGGLIIALDPGDLEAFKAKAQDLGVAFWHVGEFTDTGVIEVR